MTRLAVLVALMAVSIELTAAQEKRPNFIVLQPDDLLFFEKWSPPPHFPGRPQVAILPESGLPNIERLRTNGVQMMEAYTASAMCGTSRYSTVTGRYPSRSSFGRNSNSGQPVSNVVIPNTKLQDMPEVADGNDCSRNNLAALMKANGYRTGMVGKWHLTNTRVGYDYNGLRQQINDCGFDFAESVYAENLDGTWHDGTFSHNMEYMTARGIEHIKADPDTPFFLYFNPTVPHSSGNVLEALTSFKCTDTPAGELSSEPVIKGMTEGTTCAAYRQTVIDRANGDTTNNGVGSIWVDDAVGALLQALEDTNQLDNTFFLFQMDHGQEGKSTLWEPGIRLAQFVHYPAMIPSGGRQFDGMVSTVDIGPTILDYAGITETSPGFYPMDGKSWRQAVEDSADASVWNNDRCLFSELDEDRTVRCGCYKYMRLTADSTTLQRGSRRGVAGSTEVLVNLCDANMSYSTTTNGEVTDVKGIEPRVLSELQSVADCHLKRTLASQTPDYTECGRNNDGTPTSAPDNSPTDSPVFSPTNPPQPTNQRPTRITCSATEQYVGTPSSVPRAAPLRGNVGCVDLDVQGLRDVAVDPVRQDQDAANIYGPMEAGFSSSTPGMRCLQDNTVAGGIDTNLAEHMVEYWCPNTDIQVLDSCGGHAVPYHYHERMTCLYTADPETGHSTRVGTAGDGNGIYGKHINGGVEPTDLDACGGRFGVTPDSNGEVVYYYAITAAAPFSIGCYGPVSSVQECRDLYPDTCGAAATIVSVTTVYGTGQYATDCPCFDRDGSNVEGQGRPGFLAPPPPVAAPTESPVITSSPGAIPPTDSPVDVPTNSPVDPVTKSPGAIPPTDSPVGVPTSSPVDPITKSPGAIPPTDSPVAVPTSSPVKTTSPGALPPTNSPTSKPIGLVLTPSPIVGPYVRPAWYDRIKAETDAIGQENMKKCWKRADVPPAEGEICAPAPKVCFFGTQTCSSPQPVTKCTCNGKPERSWTCEEVKCPAEQE